MRNQRLLHDWLALLRSKKFTQTKIYLRQGDAYCALGLLALVLHASWAKAQAKGIWYGVFGVPETASKPVGLCFIPDAVLESAEILPEICEAVGRLNDDGSTFEQIADWLEGAVLPDLSGFTAVTADQVEEPLCHS